MTKASPKRNGLTLRRACVRSSRVTALFFSATTNTISARPKETRVRQSTKRRPRSTFGGFSSSIPVVSAAGSPTEPASGLPGGIESSIDLTLPLHGNRLHRLVRDVGQHIETGPQPSREPVNRGLKPVLQA